MTINVIIVGLGGIACKYDLEIYPKSRQSIQTHSFAIIENPNFNLLAGIDPSIEARHNFSKYTNLPSFINFASIPEEILESADAFIIASPTKTHLAIIEYLAKIETEPWILCEKPMTINLEEAAKIASIVDTRRIMVNYSRKFSVDINKCEVLFKQNFTDLPPNLPTLTCTIYGGLLNTGSHFLNLFSNWFKLNTENIQNGNFIKKSNSDLILSFEQAKINFIINNTNFNESFAKIEHQNSKSKITLVRDLLIKIVTGLNHAPMLK